MPFLSKTSKFIFIVFCFLFVFHFINPSPALSAPYPFMTQEEINQAVGSASNPEKKEVNAPAISYMNSRLQIAGFSSMIGCTYVAPLDPALPFSNPVNRQAIDETLQQCQYTALGQVSNGIASIYKNQPASLAWYVDDTLATAGFAKPVYAQGIGFSGLVPLLPLWKTFRNVSYVILVFVMVIIGFMVIFRMKLDPKTVISVQAALPKIIVTLLLITFSYAIAGFLIDLMYVSIAIIVYLLGTAFQSGGGAIFPGTNPGDIAGYQRVFLTADSGDLFNSVFALGLTPSAFMNFFGGSWGNAILGVGGLGLGAAAGASIAGSGSILAGIMSAPALLIGAGAVGGIIVLIILLGLLFTFIRLFFLLINAYFQILIGVILGPIFLLQEAIPGRSGFSQWILNLIANLSVFPATVAIIYLSWIFTSISWKGNLWGPPFIGLPGSASGSSGSDFGNPFATIFGLSIIFLAPNLVASIKKIFHPKPSLPITAGSAISPLTGGVSTTMGTVQQFYYPMQIMREAGSAKTWLGSLLPGAKKKE